MNRAGRIPLIRVFGIQISVSTSWFVMLFLAIFLLSSNFRQILGGSTTEAYEVAVASVVLFFSSLTLHELAHALVARRAGIEIDGIELWLLGGFSRMRSAPQTPGTELSIALAGPFTNMVLTGVFVAAGAASTSLHNFLQVAVLSDSAHASAAVAVFSWLALMNGVVFAFNLLPALPLDGGNAVHAIAWRITGDRNRAARVAAQLGRALGGVILLGGVVLLGYGNGWELIGLWLLLIGAFIAQTARGTLAQTRVNDRLQDVRVADIMDTRPVTIPGETSLLDSEENFFSRYQWPWFAVVDSVGRFLGMLALERVQSELRDGRPALTAAEVADDGTEWRVDASATLATLLNSEGLRRLGAVVAVDAEGRLQGVVTIGQVRRALATAPGV